MAPRKTTPKAKKNALPPSPMIEDLNKGFTAEELMVRNGFSQALLGFSLPNTFGPNCGMMVNQVNTLFANMRWYFISTDRIIISEAYVEHGIMAAVVDVPVADAFRGGIEIKSKQLSEEELAELKHATVVNDDLGKVAGASRWTRLFGGGAVYVITGLGSGVRPTSANPSDPSAEVELATAKPYSRPFELEKMPKGFPYKLRAIDMWEMFSSAPTPPQLNESPIDQSDMTLAEEFNYYGLMVHRSRFRIMKGIECPSLLRPRTRGWGLSIYERLVNAINQYLKSNDVLFEILDEYKVDVYKIKNLASTLLTSAGSNAFKERMMSANQVKNYNNALCIDAEDDFIQKQLVFTGIAETAEGIRMQIASALRMPMSKIFGIPATGFSSGQDDLENYNAMVESEVREPARPDVLWVLQLRCQQLFGYVPDDLEFEFAPLRVLSAEQEENVKTQKFARAVQAVSAGLIPVKEFKEMCNKGNLFDIHIDTSVDVLEPLQGAEGSEDSESGTAPKSKSTAKDAKT